MRGHDAWKTTEPMMDRDDPEPEPERTRCSICKDLHHEHHFPFKHINICSDCYDRFKEEGLGYRHDNA